jgi:hypothetical protein
MKSLMLLGALIGLIIGMTFGLAQHSTWPSVIWRSCFAAFASGMLLRWWGTMWIHGLRQAQREQMNARTAPATTPLSNPSRL